VDVWLPEIPGTDTTPADVVADVPLPTLPYPLCQPCRTDLECETADVKAPCLEEGPDARTCGFPCAADTDCPDGFHCIRDDVHGRQCRPLDDAACPCLPQFVAAGFKTVCWRENALGRCEGERTCDQECPARMPASETCNGLDDDCNGQVDEGLGTTTCGKGACEVTVQACVNGVPKECVPRPSVPETCDGVDNDCDGETDEGLGVLTCGLGICATQVEACIGGRPQPCWPLPAGVESCNGLDDDCDGSTDEGFGETTCGVGGCARTVPNCDAGGAVTCVPGDPVHEICNTIDDDCDGQTDEGLATVTCGLGACQRTVPGCVDGIDSAIACVAGTPTAETCNGIDDNCDGTIDEGFATGVPCDGPDADKCATGVTKCLPDGTAGCVEPGTGFVETCNGRDDDCDGLTDEDGVCPCPVVTNAGHLYLLCTAKAKWAVARDTCAGWGYHLASLGDAAENTFVVDKAVAVSTSAWWIGLNDLAKEGTYTWIDGTPFSYAPWGDRQPNNGGLAGNQDCVLFLEPAWGQNGRYQWNDGNCGNDGNGGDFLNFVCEYP